MALRFLPCHYHESQYKLLRFAHDYEADVGYLHHFQNLDQENREHI